MSEVASLNVLRSLSDGMALLAERLGPSVVGVGRGRRVGSGVLWDQDGHIVTCNHNLYGSETDVRMLDGRSFEGSIIGRDHYSDVGLLKIDANDLKLIGLHDNGGIRVGQLVFAAANPFGNHTSVTSGIITTPRHTIRGWWGRMMEDVIVTDAPLTPGYSGGPLVDVSGRLLGLNAALLSSRGIAIPLSTVRQVVDRLMSDGKIRTGYLGIISNTVSLPSEVTEHPDVAQERGVMVYSVERGTPADQAGLAIGDVLVKLGGNPVRGVSDLPRLLRKDMVGRSVDLLILRGGKPKKLRITPVERPAER